MSLVSQLEDRLADLRAEREFTDFRDRAVAEFAQSEDPFELAMPGLRKDVKYRGREDVLRPPPENLKGFLDRYGPLAGTVLANFGYERRLWNTFDLDPTVSGAVIKVARKGSMMRWDLKEVEPGKGDPAQYQLLHDFFAYPNGITPMEDMLFVTFARAKVLGRVYWRIIRRKIEEPVAEQIRDLFGNVVFEKLKGDYGEEFCKAVAEGFERELEGMIGDDTPVGFEYLQGMVVPIVDKRGRFKDPEAAYVQRVNFGETQTFPARDIVAFGRPHPAGGIQGLSELRLIEWWSDTKMYAAHQTREFMRGAAAAKRFCIMYGINPVEFKRIKVEMQRRANVGSADQKPLPIMARAQTKEAMDAHTVDVGDDYNAEQFTPLFREMELMELQPLNVASAMMGRTERVNRSNMEVAQYELAEEVNGLGSVVKGGATKGVIVDGFGFTTYMFDLEELDPRPISEKHRELKEDLEKGIITPYEYKERMYGKAAAEALPKDWSKKHFFYSPTGPTDMEQLAKAPPPQPRDTRNRADIPPAQDEDFDPGRRNGNAKPSTSGGKGRAMNDKEMPVGKILKSLQQWEDGLVTLIKSAAPGTTHYDRTLPTAEDLDHESGLPDPLRKEIREALFEGVVNGLPSIPRVHDIFRLAKDKARHTQGIEKEIEADELIDEARRNDFTDGLLRLHEERLQ